MNKFIDFDSVITEFEVLTPIQKKKIVIVILFCLFDITYFHISITFNILIYTLDNKHKSNFLL